MSKEIYIGADIGGTHISAAWVEPVNGIIDGTLRTAPVDGNGSGDETVQVWKSVIRKTIAGIDDIAGIGFAMPGPFDYSRGISKIEGVQKFNSLFGLNIKEAFRSILDDNTARLCFVNDATAFALGEYYAGAARGSKRCLALTLGTGFGSTFLVDGVFRETGVGIPPNGYLYNVPFKESIADDYFSTRGFVKAWQQKTGENVDGVREIAQYAQRGNPSARAVFDGFSSDLSDFLAPWIRQFNPDTVVIGGSIAKSSQLFLPGLLSELEKKNIPDTNIRISSLWDSASLTGAAMYARLQTRATTAKNSLFRKTTQFPAPEKTSPSIRGHYDIYPAFPVGTGKIHGGSDTLAARIARHKTVVIDGYEGVFWDCLIEDLNTEFLKLNKNVCWFHCDAALKQKDELYEMIKPCLGDDDSIFGKITGKNLSDWFDMDRLHKISPNPDADINILVGCGSALAGWDAPLIYVDLPKNELQFRMRAGRAFNLGFDTPADSRVMYKQAYFVDWQVLNRHKAQLLPSIGIIVDGQRPDGYLWMTGDDLREALAEMSRNFFRVRPWFEPGAWGGNWIKNNICGLNGDAENIAWSFELMTYENGLMFESDGYRLEVSFDFLMYAGYRETLGDCADRFRYDFPIRFDFLDTFDGGNLSIQCHPREEYIRREFGMPFTQDETYYILDCKDSAEVYLGFQEDIQPEKFREELVRSETQSIPVDIDRYVRKFPARKHGLFLIPNGTIHASGKDNLVLEISSAPYIFTFKMYDWLRLDLDGRPRPINIEHGMKNVDFALKGERVERELISKPRMLKRDEDEIIEHLPTHPLHFYDIHRHTFEKRITVQTQGKCHVWMLVEGKSVLLETANGLKQRFNYAETFVIPAAAQSYTLTNEDRGKVMMVKAFVR